MTKETSWEKSSKWYESHMKDEGGYNHKELILPKLIPLMNLNDKSRVLDLGCGQGILGRAIKPSTPYLGLDSSESLIELAISKDSSKSHTYHVHDVTQPIETEQTFSHAVFLLSLQNMARPQKALDHAAKMLEKGGQLILVLNHPCFRIPKYSSWVFLENHKGQYRRVDRYFSPFKSSIQTNPSKGKDSALTWSYHWPLSDYFKFLKNHFYIDDMIEICSNRKSYGRAAKHENFARDEFPLFMMISAYKK